jgi:hypothetical protein
MRKTKEVLRLRLELGLGQREIARACSISQGPVMRPVTFANVRDFIHSTSSDGRALPSPPESGRCLRPKYLVSERRPYLAIARPAQRAPDQI